MARYDGVDSFEEIDLGDVQVRFTSGRPGEFRNVRIYKKDAPAKPDPTRLKTLYRALAKVLHPDVRSSLSSAERQTVMAKVNHAYEMEDLATLAVIAATFGIASH